MTYPLLKLAHVIGLALISAGLIGVVVSDLHSRQLRDLPVIAEAIRSIAGSYKAVVVRYDDLALRYPCRGEAWSNSVCRIWCFSLRGI